MSDEELKYRAIKLDPLPRAGIAGMGLLGIGAGGVATFTQGVEAGPVAMLALGALFFIIGVAGYLPTRLKIGDNEAEWKSPVVDFVKAAIEVASEGDKQALVRRAQDFTSQLPPGERLQLRVYLAREAFEAAVENVLLTSSGQLTREEAEDHLVDYIIRGPRGKVAVVAIDGVRAGLDMGATLERLDQAGIPVLPVLLDDPILTPGLASRVRHIQYLRFNDQTDEPALRHAITRMTT